MLFADLIHWLDSHAGSLTAIATIVLCLVTAVYVAVTYLLLREQRLQARSAEVIREIVEADLHSGATLQARNLGPGVAIDVCLQAGPSRPLPEGVQIDNLGPGFDLAASDSRNWQITWVSPPPTADIWLTLSYFDRERKIINFNAFVVRLSPQGVGTSSGWVGSLDARRMRKLAAQTVSRKKRLIFRLRNRKLSLHEMLIHRSFRTELSNELRQKLEGALKWESSYRDSYGEL